MKLEQSLKFQLILTYFRRKFQIPHDPLGQVEGMNLGTLGPKRQASHTFFDERNYTCFLNNGQNWSDSICSHLQWTTTVKQGNCKKPDERCNIYYLTFSTLFYELRLCPLNITVTVAGLMLCPTLMLKGIFTFLPLSNTGFCSYI